MIELSIIVPTFNEKENIEIFLKELGSVLNNIRVVYEIIFIDDNSPDKTWEVIQNFLNKDPKIRLIRRFKEKGLSSAVFRGMEIAQGKFFLVMDADLQHDPKIIPHMLREIENHDLVVASRTHKQGSYGNFSKFRKSLSIVANSISQKILSYRISDPMSGYFIIRKEVFYRIAPKLNPKGFKILLEILGKGKDLKVSEVGYKFTTRKHGKSKLNLGVVESYLFAILELGLGNLFSVLFTRYALVGISGIFINLLGQGIGNFLFKESSYNYLENGYFIPSLAVGFGFFLSVIHNFYWNNAWTFAESKKEKVSEILFGFFVFLLVSSFGFFIQVSVWWYTHTLLRNKFSWKYLTYFCNLVGILSATVWNYYLNKSLTWKK